MKHILVFILLAPLMALAAEWPDIFPEYPTGGLLYNVKETGSLRFTCEPNADLTITCEFVQIQVRKEAEPVDLEKSLKDAEGQFQSEVKNISKAGCGQYKELLEVIEGRKPAPKPNALSTMSATERKDMSDSSKLLLQFCKTKSKQDYFGFVKHLHEQKLRTCRVISNPYKQTFKLVKDYTTGKSVWVVDSKAHGPCGVIELSRFETEQVEGFTMDMWKYYARKAVTNPKGMLFLDMSCSDLDQDEYPYDWRGSERYVGCDYIKFSVF